jgi:multisubunit Na+/H+ antiporter MnhB subunit
MKIHPSPYEQVTSLTDVVMGLIAIWCAVNIAAGNSFKADIWAWAFGLLAFSSLFGAAAHGFVMSDKTNLRLWMPINLSLGLALGMFVVGALNDLSGEPIARTAVPFMIVLGIAFFLVTVWKPGTFMTFIAYEAIAMLFALGAYGYLFFTGSNSGAGWMLAGVIVTIIAAVVQATGKPGKSIVWYFDNNGVFHLIQMVGMVLLYLGLR